MELLERRGNLFGACLAAAAGFVIAALFVGTGWSLVGWVTQ
jgi:hypothetical protein